MPPMRDKSERPTLFDRLLGRAGPGFPSEIYVPLPPRPSPAAVAPLGLAPSVDSVAPETAPAPSRTPALEHHVAAVHGGELPPPETVIPGTPSPVATDRRLAADLHRADLEPDDQARSYAEIRRELRLG